MTEIYPVFNFFFFFLNMPPLTSCIVKFFSVLSRYGVMKGSPGFIDDINPKKHRNITPHFHFLGSTAASVGPSGGDGSSEAGTTISTSPSSFKSISFSPSDLSPLPAVSSATIVMQCFYFLPS